MIDTLLECRDLRCELGPASRPVRLLRGISLSLRQGQSLGIVGESGAGKSMLIRAIMGLLPASTRPSGEILLDGQDLGRLGEQERRALLGRRVGMVFQNPMTSLNPFSRIGPQMEEASRFHLGLGRAEARTRIVRLLGSVGIPDPEKACARHPHQFSGGMKQRIMIAAALSCDPALLIADEATTALDVTVQKEVLDLLQYLQQQRGMSMILVSHNLGVVAGRTDEVLVLYGGRVVEYGPTAEIFRRPRHRYTEALLAAMPRIDQPAHQPLRSIPGQPPAPVEAMPGCPFAPRCEVAETRCFERMPGMTRSLDERHCFACHRPLAVTSVQPAILQGGQA